MAREELMRLRLENRHYRGLLVAALLHEETGFNTPYYAISGLALGCDQGDPGFRCALIQEWINRGRPRTSWRDYAALEAELRKQGEEFE